MPKPPADPVAALEIDLWLRQAAQHRAAGELGKAVPLYQRVLARDPRNAVALREMGLAALDTGAFDVATGLLTQAVEAAPRSAAALAGLGRAHAAAGRPGEAVAVLHKAQALAPRDAAIALLLGDAQLDAGDRENALKSFRLVLKLDPRHERAAHMVAALAGSADAAPRNAYASALFDSYAGFFDSHLVAALGYDAPAGLRRLVDRLAPKRRFEAALDLGCGTGLAAQAFAEKVATIDGIDLAPKMIEAARAKGLYRHLEVADIDFFLARPEAALAYDLVVAADVFIYVGRLETVFAGVAGALRTGGLFAFSLEHLEAGEVEIRSSGRFAHSEAYIDALAAAHGFTPRASEPTALRTENRRPIPGRLVVLERR